MLRYANRSAASSPADASAASVDLQTRGDLQDLQSSTAKGAPEVLASDVVAPMITPSCEVLLLAFAQLESE